MRTGELKAPLLPLMAAIFAHVNGPEDETMEQVIVARWADFNAQRMKILVHCL